MNYPKISIVTPSYNQGQYIEDTILSVLGQRYPNLEYLIFDAKSTDNSVEIIKMYETELTYWETKEDYGQADAINKGFARATGEILMWLNSDDVLMPNVLKYIGEQYLEKGEGIYFGNCIHFEEKKGGDLYSSGSDVNGLHNSTSIELIDMIIQPSSFWSKQVWEKVGNLDVNLNFGFDWEWFLRATNCKIEFYPLNKPISLYRHHPNHKSGSGGVNRQKELLKIYQLYSPKYAELFKILMEEKYIFSIAQRIMFKFLKFFHGEKYTKFQFIKLIKNKDYKKFTLKEMELISHML